MPDSYEHLKAHFDRIQAEDIAARVKLYADHSVALQFVRELAELSMLGMSDPRERDLILRARKWLHTESNNGPRDRRSLEACSNCGGSGSLLDMSCCSDCGGGGKVLR